VTADSFEQSRWIFDDSRSALQPAPHTNLTLLQGAVGFFLASMVIVFFACPALAGDEERP